MLLDKNICSFHNLVIAVLRGFGERTYPSDIRDVQKRVSAEVGIEELIIF